MRLRLAVPGDLPLVVQTYVRHWPKAILASELPRGWAQVAERFVAACFLRGLITVACAPDDEDQILGYSIAERRPERAVVHWLYVRGPFRRFGVARRMMAAVIEGAKTITITHTAAGWQRAIVRREGWQASDRLPWLWLLSLDEETQDGDEEEAPRAR